MKQRRGIRVLEGVPDGKGLRIALVASRFNDLIGQRLLEGALEALTRKGVRPGDITCAWVPGAWEIPVVAERFARTRRFDGVIALGTVIRGETTHHEHIGRETAAALREVTEETGVPVAFGVLTTETLEQALERCGARRNNKGCEAALHLLETISVLRRIGK
jgi:6,7-dimethyl-8-ribityllumazine synthase